MTTTETPPITDHDIEAAINCLRACAEDPGEPERYREWYSQALASFERWQSSARTPSPAGPSWAEVEAWLKTRRAAYPDTGLFNANAFKRDALDDALDELREHMHTGTPLGQSVKRTEEDVR